jgi:tripartite-type tricarboxylate transporter receptor subunit TctC
LATFSPLVLVVHPSLPVTSVQQLIALAKARPGELNVGTSQTGTQVHLASELFRSMAGINTVRITYKSVGQLTTDLIGGHVQMSFPGAAAMAHVHAGRLRALAVTSLNPTPLVPGLPTLAASGMPGFEAGSLYSVFAPAKTPVSISTRLNREMVTFLRKPDVKEKFFQLGLDVVASSPDELAAKVKSEINVWGKIIKSAGITPD